MNESILQAKSLFSSSRQPFLVGNGKTTALINKQGTIVWLDLRYPHQPVFMGIAAPEKGGYFSIKLLDMGRNVPLLPKSQGYVENTNVLETRLEFGKGIEASIKDFMPAGHPMLVRKISISNKSPKRHRLELTYDAKINRGIPMKIENGSKGIVYRNSTLSISVTGLPRLVDLEPHARTEHYAILSYGTGSAGPVSISDAELDALYRQTVESWQSKAEELKKPSNYYAPLTNKMAIALLTLIDGKSGALVAAPTTSIPSVPGGIENWDYRYSWVRDSSYAMEALLELGLYEETRRMLDFFLSLQEADGNWKHPFYTSDGKSPPKEVISDVHSTVDGTEVRFGNQASTQQQLDTTPHVIRSVYNYVKATGNADYAASNWKRIEAAASSIIRDIGKKDSGIWESRPKNEGSEWFNLGEKHFTYSKCMQYAGLKAASSLARMLGEDFLWSANMEKLRMEILESAWSEERKSFVQSYDGPAVIDVSVLALVRHGLISTKDPRWVSTVSRIENALVVNGGVKRHEMAESCFYPATFWWAEYLIGEGRYKEANDVINRSITSSETGLLAEHHVNESDNSNPEQLGNIPLAWSMAGAIKALFAYDRALKNADV